MSHTSAEIIEKVSTLAKEFKMTLRVQGQSVALINSTGQVAAIINPDGSVERKFNGGKALLGTFGAQQIKAVL